MSTTSTEALTVAEQSAAGTKKIVNRLRRAQGQLGADITAVELEKLFLTRA